jgi:hypothetical protein
MQYVIRFPDGMFNSGYGFDVPLRDADRYATREEAEKVLRGDGADGSGGLVDGEVSTTMSSLRSVAYLLMGTPESTISDSCVRRSKK